MQEGYRGGFEREFSHKDTILKVKCDRDIGDFVEGFITEKRLELERYITLEPQFKTSFEPLEVSGGAPEIAGIMADAGRRAGVGPMAAVAGTISELLIREAVKRGVVWMIAENGGDICLFGDRNFNISLFAGKSRLSGKLGFSINPGKSSYAICTSSSSVGHSISLGRSDAVTVFAKSASVADAFATAIGNRVDDIGSGLDYAKRFLGRHIDGVVIVKGDEIAKAGRIPEIIGISDYV